MRYILRSLSYAVFGDWEGNGWRVFPMYGSSGLNGKWSACGPMDRFRTSRSFEQKEFSSRRAAIAFAKSTAAEDYFKAHYPGQ